MEPVRAATILHADLDAFYASVEQLLEPTLRKRPIAVGGGVVLAASYEARSFGVAAGMSGWQARRLCPGLHFVHGHFAEYQRLGDQVVAVFRDFTPWVERISIDEAFLDVAGARKLLGSPATLRWPSADGFDVRSAYHFRSAWPRRSIWQRLRRKWPSRMAWWWLSTARRRRSLSPFRWSSFGGSARLRAIDWRDWAFARSAIWPRCLAL